MELQQQPGFYEITSAIIKPISSDAISIAPLIVGMTITESINNDSLRGSMQIYDSAGLIHNAPLRGEEEFTVTIRDPFGTETVQSFFIYKISDIKPTKQADASRYTLHFVSKQRFLGNLKRIRRSFRDRISSIAGDIYSEFYGDHSEKTFNIQQTEGLLKCVIPNLRPYEAFKFLAERSYSPESPSCTFRFFENMNEIYFASDEWMSEYQKEDPVLHLSYNPHLEFGSTDSLKRMFAVKTVQVDNFNNSMNDLNTGALKHSIVNIDFEQGVVDNLLYDYAQVESLYKKPDDARPAHTSQFRDLLTDSDHLKVFLNFKDYASEGDQPSNIRAYDYSPEILSSRIGYGARLNNTILSISTHGRLDLNAGRTVSMTMPKFTAGNETDMNSDLSGVYQVVDVNHVFGESYECYSTIRRYDLGPLT